MNATGHQQIGTAGTASAPAGALEQLRRLEVPAETICWHRFFGALELALLCLLFFSGALMALSYSPVPGTAYDSVDHLQYNLPLGGLVRGVHHYAWNLLLVVMGLHLSRAFVMKAYQAPRQLAWVSGVLFFMLVPLFIITGDLLPWDQKGYWSTQVRFSIIGSIPAAGELIVQMLRGGSLTGIVALTRLYVLHVVLLPWALVLLVAFHLYAVASRGLSGPLSDKSGPRATVRFFPAMVNRWLVVLIAAGLVLGGLAWFWPAPLGDPADPTDSAFVPRPEWWVLSLNQLVAIFKGPLMIIGSAVIPGGLIALLLALPFLDRSPQRRPSRRKAQMAVAAAILGAVLVLSVMGYIEHFVRPDH